MPKLRREHVRARSERHDATMGEIRCKVAKVNAGKRMFPGHDHFGAPVEVHDERLTCEIPIYAYRHEYANDPVAR